MPFDSDNKTLPPAEQLTIEPIGPVTIGHDNPAGITQEDWVENQNLLFHGAVARFDFRRGFNYLTDQIDGFHSHTAGEGFYTTPKYEDALMYAMAFSGKNEPVVISLLPYQARMFDFRSQDQGTNAKVPSELFHAYISFINKKVSSTWKDYNPVEDEEFVKTHPLGGPDLERRANAVSFEDHFAIKPTAHDKERSLRVKRIYGYRKALNYYQRLSAMSESGNRVDLREMLSLVGSSEASEYGSRYFSEFMISHGYDGVIFIEGGDHPEHHNPTSYIFYNLNKIGTFEAWNQQDRLKSDSPQL